MGKLDRISYCFNKLGRFSTLVRGYQWWEFKGAPVLGTVYATSALLNVSLIALWPLLLFILFWLAVAAAYANILNDLADQKDDLVAGKENRMAGRSRFFKVAILAACLLPGVVAMAILSQAPVALALYLGIWLVFATYSLPPLRLKQRGFWGVLADATGANLLPQLFAVATIGYWVGEKIPLMWWIAVGIWAMACGVRGILWHQLVDLENDRVSGVNTFAVRTSPERVQQLARWVIFPLEAIAFATLLFLSHNLLAWLLLGFYLSLGWLRHYFWRLDLIIVVSSEKYRIALYEYYNVFYPLAFLTTVALNEPLNSLIALAHFTLFPLQAWECVKNCAHLTRDIWRWLQQIKLRFRQKIVSYYLRRFVSNESDINR
jgi:4-hydroxybenzoate polyprenyltransferase